MISKRPHLIRSHLIRSHSIRSMDSPVISYLSHLQDAFNESISANWRTSRSELDFQLALNQEIAELIDSSYTIDGKTYSLAWKWWKGCSGERTTDRIIWADIHPKVKANIKIELTDCLFFLLSQLDLYDGSSGREGEGDRGSLMSSNDWENIMNIPRLSLNRRPKDAIEILLKLADRLSFNIAAYYLAKFTLNHIRQLTGYKNGTYTKVIDGVEDNELLHEIIKDITTEDLEVQFPHFCTYIMGRVYDTFKIPDKDRKYYSDWTGVDLL